MSANSKALTTCLLLPILACFTSFVVYYRLELPDKLFEGSEHTDRSLPLPGLWVFSALNACVDTALALSLVILLHRSRSEIPFSRTSSVISRIIMYTSGTGVLTAAFALAGLIASVVMTKNFVFVLIFEILPKRESIYMNLFVF